MNRGLYIAASGMLAAQLRQDLLANDLANVSTPGYKPDRASQASFGEVLLANTSSGAPVGSIAFGVEIGEVVTDTKQATLRNTDEPLDLALEGDGFLAVAADTGVRYIRGGRMIVDAEGRLTTTTGLPLLSTAGRPIVVRKETGVVVGADGTVTVDGAPAGQLGLVTLTGVRKEGYSLYTGTPGTPTEPVAIRQGMLESSGSDAARAMVDMLVSLRAFEASQRVIRTIDETLGRAVNAAGQVS